MLIVVLTGRVALLLLVGVLPVVAFPSWTAFAAWVAFVAVLVIVDAMLAGSPRRLTIERGIADRVRLGEATEQRMLVTNTGSRRVRGLLRDHWTPTAGATPARSRIDVPPGERRIVRMTLRPFRRGERRTQAVTVRSFGPLGLSGRQATIAAPARIRVLPAFRSRRHLPSRLARLRELDGATTLQVRGQGTEFDSLREYVRGDDVRSIDWRATARSRDVVVRTWRPERDRRVVIVIDTGRLAAARVGEETRLDTALESALLLAALADRAGDRVAVIAYDRRVRARVTGASGAELLPRLVDALAPVEAELIETDWSAIPAEVDRLTNGRSLVVLLTALDSVGSASGLLDVLPGLTRRHLVIVAGVTDPALAAAESDRVDRDAVYRAGAAARTLLDERGLRLGVARLGADVVTAPPLELPPALADRYLSLKAAARL